MRPWVAVLIAPLMAPLEAVEGKGTPSQVLELDARWLMPGLGWPLQPSRSVRHRPPALC